MQVARLERAPARAAYTCALAFGTTRERNRETEKLVHERGSIEALDEVQAPASTHTASPVARGRATAHTPTYTASITHTTFVAGQVTVRGEGEAHKAATKYAGKKYKLNVPIKNANSICRFNLPV